jgi:anti-sigma regulatory factor (Ser/Thr protein kinase)
METTFQLRAAPTSVSAARHATRGFGASLPISIDDALVVVSELVTNAVLHGTEPITLCLAWNGQLLWIGVTDGDACVGCVTATRPSAGVDHGRGLALTDHLARSWGTYQAHDGLGKTVWAIIAS